MRSAGRYWFGYIAHIAVGLLVGLLVGLIIQNASGIEGWGMWCATAGAVAGIFYFVAFASAGKSDRTVPPTAPDDAVAPPPERTAVIDELAEGETEGPVEDEPAPPR